MAFAIARISKHKRGDLDKVDKHNMRRKGAEKMYQHTNPSGAFHVLRGKDKTVEECVDEIIKKTEAKENADSVVGVELMLTASPEYFRPDEPWEWGKFDAAKTHAWASAAVRWCEEHYGADRIAHAVLHLDEATPHLHIEVVPFNTKLKNKRRTKAQIEAGAAAETYEHTVLDAKTLFNREALTELQDSYAAAMKPLGLDRGMRKSKAKHQSVKQYYTQVNKGQSINYNIQVPNITEPPVFGRGKWLDETKEALKKAVKKVENKYNRAIKMAQEYKRRWIRAQRELTEMKKAQNALYEQGGPVELFNERDELEAQNQALELKNAQIGSDLRQAQFEIGALKKDNRELASNNDKLSNELLNKDLEIKLAKRAGLEGRGSDLKH